MKQLNLILLVALALSIVSCGSTFEEYKLESSSEEYFPLEIGNTWVYSIDSIIYDNNGTDIDTIKSIIKEVIADTFIDGSGTTNYAIERFKKSGSNWVKTRNWSAYINDKYAVRNEENLSFIRMTFPIAKNNCWDGNSLIDADDIIVKIAGEPIKMYDNWKYHYSEVNTSESINDTKYENVHTVLECDNENRLNKRYSVAKYAKNTGLIYRRMMILDTQKSTEDSPWEEKAEQGFILEQTLLSFVQIH